ncbi:MAG TPA: histidinol-phosphate transaminase [Acidimicrobiales bacterium]|nr:histidinol-phosphate transaminase [Acidimicrobiales bacterium]
MSARPPVRPDLKLNEGYHSPQVEVEVRLNTNESPFPPPQAWSDELLAALGDASFHRYPDRPATELRAAIAELHEVTPAEVFCANGSNEVLQCLLLAYGGPGRKALVFEPTYALHSHISRLTGTEVIVGGRTDDFRIDPDDARRLITQEQPDITFLCSPNNPTGRSEPRPTVEAVLDAAPGLVIVDEAYGQFSSWSALSLRSATDEHPGLVVTRTFSKTWAMAGARLGYLVADPEVVQAADSVALPYHLSTQTQLAGLLALRHTDEMEARVALISEERGRIAAALADLPVESWPSDANFILFRPLTNDADAVWQGLLDRSILVRNCAGWDGLPGCLRVTIGRPDENDRFLEALKECL